MGFRTMGLLLAGLLFCMQLCGCAAEQPLTLDGQLELGTRYLSELDYENAVIAFTAAIEIDPRNAQAYAGLYAAYIVQGNPQKADETWAAMLEAGVSADEALLWIESIANRITEGGGNGEAVKQAAQEKNGGREMNGDTPAYAATQDKKIEITITPTDITADSVFNSDGYGSLSITGEMGEFDYDVPPQTALINSSGEFVFPYLSTEGRYYYNDGVVTLCSRYNNSGIYSDEIDSIEMGYYNIDGTMLLSADRWANRDDLLTRHLDKHPAAEGWTVTLHDRICIELHPFGDGVAFVRCLGTFSGSNEWSGSGSAFAEDECYLVDKQGNILLTIPEEFSRSIAGLPGLFSGMGGLWYSSEGLIKIGCVYRLGDHISDTTNSNCYFMDGQWVTLDDYSWYGAKFVYGFMDHSGNMVIPQMYSSAGDFSEGLAAVCNADGIAGYIDKSGNTVVPFEYNSAYPFTDGLAAVSKDGKTGYINVQNEIVIPFDYDNGFTAGGGVCPVAKDGYYGLIDYNGNEVLPCEYDDISTCAEGVVYAIKDRQVYIITVNQQRV